MVTHQTYHQSYLRQCRGVFRAQSNIYDLEKNFAKKLNRRCSSGFLIHICNFSNNHHSPEHNLAKYQLILVSTVFNIEIQTPFTTQWTNPWYANSKNLSNYIKLISDNESCMNNITFWYFMVKPCYKLTIKLVISPQN